MADDDLDRLLDEVESKYCHPGAGPGGAAADKTRVKRKASKAIVTVDDEDVDDLIEDILDVRFYEENKHKAKSTEHQSCKSSTQHPSKKCCPVYLGGSGIPFGIGTSISERACDQLRCTTCDFNIVMFDDYKWEASCDYLFFRTADAGDQHRCNLLFILAAPRALPENLFFLNNLFRSVYPVDSFGVGGLLP
ncbi:cilia- and flagella-associated protein 418 isoform X5 [Hyla sarda]|uniref:cilia- and flagella-associated protein 418 isoform X5 n=1 Tax=Hyla sarda TaxID=327740 RepID=UPI0024C3D61F|nr:cilia- and flagella-associated protein 418 isoform X5 [Hyla sarda]